MKKIQLIVCILLIQFKSFSQIEITTGYATDRNLADGAPIQIGYDIKIKNKLYTKFEIGYKHLYHYNDYVGAKLKKYIFEFQQMVSYEVIKHKKYILKPNIGINYRFYKWKGQMLEPLNTLPLRAWVIGTRDGNFVLESTDAGYKKTYKTSNFGYGIQLQNQFKLSNKIWLHITPFIEPDFDGSQNNGGCYIGIILKQEQ